MYLSVDLTLRAQSSGIVLGPASGSFPGVDRGELLLGELACVSCHPASDGVKARLAGRSSPILGADGLLLTPQFIRSYLANPANEKPGTTMPDLLSGFSEERRAEAVEALVHYLISITPAATATNNTGDSAKVVQGRELFHAIGCVACHAPEIPKGGTDAAAVARLKPESVPFPNLAQKTTVSELSKFLVNPLKYRHSGRMPAMNLSEREANLLAVYLLRDQSPATAEGGRGKTTLPGLVYQYYESNQIRSVGDMDNLNPLDEGFVDRVGLTPRHRNENYGFRFQGLLRAEKAGEYSFFVNSDDGSKLYIDGKPVVDNDGEHAAQEVTGVVQLEAGDHDFMLLYYNVGGDQELGVAWKRPGANRDRLPPKVLFHAEQKMEPVESENFTLDAAKAAKGGELFSSLGCAACHDVGRAGAGAVASAKPLLELDPAKGCLADKPSEKSARYAFNARQLNSLRATLQNKPALTQPLDPKVEAAYTLTRLNCVACHSRNGIGGPSTQRSPYFVSVGEVDLGDEGRIPPHLNAVGSKLRPEWLREVFLNKATGRPYMATRMPQFGSNNVAHLVSLLPQTDGPLKDEPPVNAEDAKWGRKLVGTGGMSCISCHTFARHKSLGVPAMDLTLTSKRLRNDWFTRYLLNPASLRPGTRMPPFWPEGKSTRAEILGGDTTRQINALWAYLSSPKDVGLPDGLVQGKLELVADKEAVIYRNFITGSPRSIGVGYPEKANLSWDANDCRLVSIWQGAFIDAARHREGRGEGFANALGYNVVQFSAGAPLAILESPDLKWPTVSGKAAGYQMKGYVLDDLRRPTFRYAFAEIQVEDFFAAQGAELEASFIRTLSFKGAKPPRGLWFRAWAGSSAEARTDGSYLLDGKIKMKITSPSGASLVRQSDGKWELLVPVNLPAGEARIVQEIVW